MPSVWKFLLHWGPLLFFIAPFLVTSISMWSFGKEVDANEKFDVPEQHQVYWHVVHNRQDIKAIYFMVAFGLATIIALLLRIADKLNAFDN